MSLHTSDLVLVPGQQLPPLETISGFQVRPGFFRFFGATVIPGGVNFTIQSHGATVCELLFFHKGEDDPFAILPFPDHYKIGFVYSMIVFGFDIEKYEYAYRLDGPYDEKRGLRFDAGKILLDPYARAVTGQSQWGCVNHLSHGYRARVTHNNFDWGDSRHIQIPMEDLIIYELHVRGFTQDPSSNVECPGTFRGLEEKIPYLNFLAVNSHWTSKQLVPPPLPKGYVWKIAVNTGDPLQQTFEKDAMPIAGQSILLGERSVIVFAGVKTETAS